MSRKRKKPSVPKLFARTRFRENLGAVYSLVGTWGPDGGATGAAGADCCGWAPGRRGSTEPPFGDGAPAGPFCRVLAGTRSKTDPALLPWRARIVRPIEVTLNNILD